MTHNTVKLLFPFNTLNNSEPIYLDVDSGIAELIEQIWKAGIETTYCCQHNSDHNDNMHVQFSSQHYEKFISIITDFENPTDKTQMFLYDLIYNKTNHDEMYTVFNLINSNHPVINCWPKFRGGSYKHPISKMIINCNFYFKKEYYDMILSKVIKYNEHYVNSEYDEELIFHQKIEFNNE
jgi:hypothetical protein